MKLTIIDLYDPKGYTACNIRSAAAQHAAKILRMRMRPGTKVKTRYDYDFHMKKAMVFIEKYQKRVAALMGYKRPDLCAFGLHE